MIYIVGNLYVITNTINGSKYIGKTYNTLAERFANHITSCSEEETRYRPLYKAMREYGTRNFTIELLGIFKQGVLEQKEIEYIAKYKDKYSLYNITDGGEGSLIVPPHLEPQIIRLYCIDKLPICKIAEQLHLTKYCVNKVLRNNYIFTNNVERLRYLASQEVGVQMINPNDDSVIREFSSIARAGRYVGTNDASNITKVCKGKREKAYGYKWVYK